jgi:DNA polymerase I-like protein with 3'-5' exonuclease and polymerase domains
MPTSTSLPPYQRSSRLAELTLVIPDNFGGQIDFGHSDHATREQERHLLKGGVSNYQIAYLDEQSHLHEMPKHPEVIATVGAGVTRHFLGPRSMEISHGMVYHSTSWDCPIIPLYNPVAGMYNNNLQPTIHWDYKRLGAYLSGKLPMVENTDQFPTRQDCEYRELTTCEELIAVTDQWASQPIAVDTEGSAARPWSLSFSWKPGTAYVIRPGTDAMDGFICFVAENSPLFIFHNSLHDVSVLRALGIQSQWYTYEDTMIMAYQLQVEPQGLKQLSRRWAGMSMSSYPEIVAEANDQIAWDYLTTLYGESSWPTTPPRTDFEGGQLKKKRPWPLNRYLKRLFDDYTNGKVEVSDFRGRWDKWHVGCKLPALEAYGPMPEATLDDVPLDVAIQYSARDADATIRIYPQLKAMCDLMKLQTSLESDFAVVPMIEFMQSEGMAVNVSGFKEVSDELLGMLLNIHEEVEGRLGTFKNLNSSDQIADLFYNTWEGQIPEPPRRTETGKPSLNEAGLSTIRVNLDTIRKPTPEQQDAFWLIDKTLDYRGILKLRNTYAEKIPLFVHGDGRLHPNLRITKVITGRLSAFNPNVLAIPTRDELAKLIKRNFISKEGYSLGTWDFSGIEMRVMAHMSQDPILLENFHKGIDQHSRTASMIFGKPMDQIDKKTERFPAKTMGFLIIYGGGPMTLQANLKKEGLDWPLDKCEELIEMYLDIHKGIRSYMKQQVLFCRRYGFSETHRGRKRLLPGIWSEHKYVRLEAERAAINFPIQGTAQEIIKEAMAQLWAMLPSLWDDGIDLRPLLQIHDELFCEFPTNQWEVIDPLMVNLMENCWKLDIPMIVGGDYGPNWAEVDK